MGWKLNLQYGHVILVSKHPVLTAVSWPQHGYHSRNTGVNDGRMYGHVTTKIDNQTFLALGLRSRTQGALL